MTKYSVVVFVEGGVVQAVYTDAPKGTIGVDLIDFDNLKEEGKSRDERDDALKAATKGMREIF